MTVYVIFLLWVIFYCRTLGKSFFSIYETVMLQLKVLSVKNHCDSISQGIS